MKKILLFSSAILMLIASCREQKSEPKAEPIDTIPVMVMQIQKCSRLYTSEYHVHKIVTHDDQMKLSGSIMKQDFTIDLPLGDRRVAIPIDATLKTYVDFSGFSEKNVKRNGQKITVTLPDPKITLTSTKIDHTEVKQYVALTRSNFSDAELSNYERQGRKSIIRAIPKMGIIENARKSAASTIIPLIVAMGYKEQDITVTFRKEFTTKDLSHLLDKSTVEKEQLTAN
ncbi:MAG: DUF4230 domain-containing protein [Prevotella sp.]|nr:DUF4230 domain-containing protein [Prevotella sp.]